MSDIVQFQSVLGVRRQSGNRLFSWVHCRNLFRSVKFGIRLVCLLALMSVGLHASADGELSNVRALIYSSTAAELQWTRPNAERVQVSYDGRVIATLDANSYFTEDLDPNQYHRFELALVNSDGSVSDPVALAFSSADFSLPVREILPSSMNAASSGLLSGAKMIAYSKSAVELFWQRIDPQLVEVEVFHNGESIGTYDATSLFVPNLDPNALHQFEIRPINRYSQTAESYTLFFNAAEFSGQTYETQALQQSLVSYEPESGQSTQSPVVETVPSIMAPETPAEPDLSSASTAESPTPIVNAPTEQLQNDDAAPPPPELLSVAVKPGDCVVHSLTDLTDCVNAAQGLDRINIQSNLACTSDNCCPTGGALLRLDNVSNLSIFGNGYELRREGGQRQCSLLDITNSADISILNWTLDDDARDAPCVVDDKCPRMLHIRTSDSVRLDNVTVTNAKSYAIYVQQVDGFVFADSTLLNSGVLGLYIGHDEKSSTNVRVERSTFLDNQTNALALLGVTGSSVNSNIISDNVFRRNHWRGQWPVAPRYGTGFTGGGQVYLAQVNGVTFTNNVITDGYCENCFVQQVMGSGVSGLELARPGLNSVSNTLITHNTVQNHDAWGIFVNEGSSVNSTVIIGNNQLVDNTVGLKVGAASQFDNVVRNR